MSDPHATERFSACAGDYARYRPSYPPETVELLRAVCGWGAGSVIAEVGSGTGLFTRRVLELGAEAIGIEPNAAMRAAGDAALGGCAGFRSLEGTAERTGLPDGSVDGIAAAQAFHWFRPDETRAEFRRILRPGGWVALLWNERRTDTSAFLRVYDELLLRYGKDYAQVDHRNFGAAQMDAFFGGGAWQAHAIAHAQILDLEGVLGRTWSCSYVPAKGEANHDALGDAVTVLFAEHAEQGRIRMDYWTQVYLGRLDGPPA